MGSNGPFGARTKFIIGLAIGIVAVLVLAGIALLVFSNNDQPVLSNTLTLGVTGNGIVTDDQLLAAKNVLQKRFDALHYNVSISMTRHNLEYTGLAINYDNVPASKMALIATTPGLVDMRIQTSGNESEHILYGDEIKSASLVMPDRGAGGQDMWGASIQLAPSGAKGLQQACVEYGATTDPFNHSIMFLLDGKRFWSAPLSEQLAAEMATQPVDHLMLSTGPGENGKNIAELATACLQSGVLPLRMEVVSNGNATM